MKLPRAKKLAQDGTHRLMPRQAVGGGPVLNRLADHDDDLLRDLAELEGATNDRLLAESGKLPGISLIELVSGFSLDHVVNAAFAHPHPAGARFSSSRRGAWYAAFQLETAQAEVAFHKAGELREVGWKQEETCLYQDYLADFRHEFHDICKDRQFAHCLHPKNYAASQALGQKLLTTGSAGIIYPSVRDQGHACVVCFRPPLVLNVQEGPLVRFTFVDAKLAEVTVKS
jgi:hypothetical protein